MPRSGQWSYQFAAHYQVTSLSIYQFQFVNLPVWRFQVTSLRCAPKIFFSNYQFPRQNFFKLPVFEVTSFKKNFKLPVSTKIRKLGLINLPVWRRDFRIGLRILPVWWSYQFRETGNFVRPNRETGNLTRSLSALLAYVQGGCPHRAQGYRLCLSRSADWSEHPWDPHIWSLGLNTMVWGSA